eukprot:1182318-Prorocentrum_minimum.AAC.2
MEFHQTWGSNPRKCSLGNDRSSACGSMINVGFVRGFVCIRPGSNREKAVPVLDRLQVVGRSSGCAPQRRLELAGVAHGLERVGGVLQ